MALPANAAHFLAECQKRISGPSALTDFTFRCGMCPVPPQSQTHSCGAYMGLTCNIIFVAEIETLLTILPR